MNQNPRDEDQQESFIYRAVMKYWWARVLLGAGAMWAAYDSYSIFTKLENAPPGPIRIEHPIWVSKQLMILHGWGGKWPIVGTAATAGAFLIVIGIWPLVSGKDPMDIPPAQHSGDPSESS